MNEDEVFGIEHDEQIEALEADEDVPEDEAAALWSWYEQLPDFIKKDYELDIPAARLPLARQVFTEVGAPRFCPQAACRRSGACEGGNGPPCFRADRSDLSHVLRLRWLTMYTSMTEEEYEASLRERGNRYAPAEKPSQRAKPEKKRHR